MTITKHPIPSAQIMLVKDMQHTEIYLGLYRCYELTTNVFIMIESPWLYIMTIFESISLQ